MEKYLFLFRIIAGLAMLFVEQAIPTGFFIFFFGIAAILTGSLAAIGILPSLTLQLIVVIALSLLLAVFRKNILALFASYKSLERDDTDSLVGTRGQALETVTPGGRGKVELRGGNWTAKNVGTAELQAGDDFLVVSVDGLVLNITKE